MNNKSTITIYYESTLASHPGKAPFANLFCIQNQLLPACEEITVLSSQLFSQDSSQLLFAARFFPVLRLDFSHWS